MSVLTFKSEEFQTFPKIIREYASYVSTIRGNSEKTVCEYMLDLRTFFRYYKVQRQGGDIARMQPEEISISDLTLEDVAAVRSTDIIEFLIYVGFERENTTTTRLRKISALRSFYRFLCNKRHYIERDPTSDIESPKKKKTLPKYLTYEECLMLLQAIRDDTYSATQQRDFAIVVMFLNTGMRLSELVGLNLDSIAPDLSVAKVLGKGSKERVVYLNESCADALKDYLRVRLDARYVRTSDKALFLSRRETRISVKTVQWLVYKYLARAGFGDRGLSVHKLRHTAATLMYQTGNVDIRLLKDILGHEQLTTTQIYTHVVDKNLHLAMDQNPLSHAKIKKGNIDENR